MGQNLTAYLTDEKLSDSTIPVALSKPVYLHNIKCTRRDLTLLECGFTRYTSDTKMVQDATTKCQQRKFEAAVIADVCRGLYML